MSNTTDKYKCPCGSKIKNTTSSIKKHQNSKKHMENFGIDYLIEMIVKDCIKNNWVKDETNDDWGHWFNKDDIKSWSHSLFLDGGRAFIDPKEDWIKEQMSGFIRLNFMNCNPKYSWWIEDGKIKYDMA